MDLTPRLPDVPPGYPAEYRQQVTLRDGRRVFIRPVLPSDAPELADAIKAADPETLRRRFLGGPPPVTAALLEHLTTVDYVRRLALVAIDPTTQRGVAIARYEQVRDEVAEIAVVVTPAWRRAGLATTLILLLAKAAVDRGIHTFTASYLAENRAIAALATDAGGLANQLIERGIAEFSFALGNEPPPAAPDGAAQTSPGETNPGDAGPAQATAAETGPAQTSPAQATAAEAGAAQTTTAQTTAAQTSPAHTSPTETGAAPGTASRHPPRAPRLSSNRADRRHTEEQRDD